MRKKPIILIMDRDNYFSSGLRRVLKEYFLTQGTLVRFTTDVSIDKVDIIFHAQAPGETLGICHRVTDNSPPPYYFVIRDRTLHRLSNTNGCIHLSAELYRHQKIDEILVLVKEAINTQPSQLAGLPVCSICHKRSLSLREREVLFYLNSGFNQTQTANRMQLKVKTVNSHKASAMRKLNLKHNLALIHWLLLGGLH